MEGWKKLAIGAGIVAGGTYLWSLNRAKTEIETIATAKIHKLDLGGLTVRVDVQVKNPTKSTLKVKYPFVKLLFKKSMIGSSQSINQDITLPAFGEAQIVKIMISIPISGLFSVASELFQSLNNGNGVKIIVKTISTIDLGWKSLPYEKEEEVVLKK